MVTQKFILVSPTFIAEFEQLKALVRGIRGVGVTNTPQGINIVPPPPARRTRPGGSDEIFKRVRLKNTGDGVYAVYDWGDEDMEGTPIAIDVVPLIRPFGTDVDFVIYGLTGFGYSIVNDDGDDEFVLLSANEETYDKGPCPT